MSETFTDSAQDVAGLTSERMPASPSKISISVRANPEQKEAWVKAAQADGRALETWIRHLCDLASIKAGFPPVPPTPSKPRRKPGR